LAKLSPGIEVTVIEQERWFVRVRFKKVEGWIPSQFIKVHKNNNIAPRSDQNDQK